MGKELSYQKYDPAWGEEPVPPVPDEYRGETVKAYVVIKPGTVGKVGEDEIIQFCRDHMAVYKAPKMVEFVEELPKTPSGKVLRRLLRARHAESNKR